MHTTPLYPHKVRIAIAGGRGFIGENLCKSLVASAPEKYQIKILSRSEAASEGPIKTEKCDIYSLLDCERALQDIDVAVYLVHSMLSSAGLNQGSFRDYDLILADNFARACQKNRVQQIIYLGGLLPPEEALSEHLLSRYEVEELFFLRVNASTVFRAGLIVGANGSSFEIMRRLVEKLPFMICPLWTLKSCQSIDVDDVSRNIQNAILNTVDYGQTYDIGGCEILTYLDMMRILAKTLNKKRRFFIVPVFKPRISRLWVTLVSGAPKNLVYPLIESLRHNMVCDPQKSKPYSQTIFAESCKKAICSSSSRFAPRAFLRNRTQNDVRSVYRIYLPPQMHAEEAALHYMMWLQTRFKWLFRVQTEGQRITFKLSFAPISLLILELSRSRSTKDRQLFYIKGGLLAKNLGKGRLEFREFPHQSSLIIALHDYHPTLPWQIYKYTQARVHVYVIRKFEKYLQGLQMPPHR